jgi:drug/metabolite transporter (DMT)-like permease
VSPLRLAVLTLLALAAFAGNSLLCRLALLPGGAGQPSIDAASFTTVRMASGALMLVLLVGLQGQAKAVWAAGRWRSAAALFGYAILFSWAYLSLGAAVGALLLFGAVQISMLTLGWWVGERLAPRQWLGFVLACGGLAALLLPGAGAPPVLPAVLMALAGVCWGVYSWWGKAAGAAGVAPTLATAGHFVRAVPLALAVSALVWVVLGLVLGQVAVHASPKGLGLAVASGAITSGLGYAIWYAVLPHIKAATAATLQLSVPVITALAAVALLGEVLSLRLVVCSAVVLGGVWLVIRQPRRAQQPKA